MSDEIFSSLEVFLFFSLLKLPIVVFQEIFHSHLHKSTNICRFLWEPESERQKFLWPRKAASRSHSSNNWNHYLSRTILLNPQLSCVSSQQPLKPWHTYWHASTFCRHIRWPHDSLPLQLSNDPGYPHTLMGCHYLPIEVTSKSYTYTLCIPSNSNP